ncbi:trans-aconitate 2-methyltransferase [uncultured Sphingomonas sp.]|uniref:class I SAM-dependent methyltransferase n=1 Tax=uncultured Sphingomonas sp. TaxID=158754 RepID=UPI002603D9E6|nr:class I SAM-dependent methyltransferase [uncultured Sphingomonas sp.]
MTDALEWRGRVGDVWADEWRFTDMGFAGLARVLDAAIAAGAPVQGRALDIGCGAGATTLALAAARPGLNILGVDLSERLVAVARSRGAERANVTFRVADASRLHSEPDAGDRFDLAFSRHGVMFFADPATAFRRIGEVLHPGAALVFSCFAELGRNSWVTEIAKVIGSGAPSPSLRPDAASAGEIRMAAYQPGPFAFADQALVRAILEQAGFVPGEPQRVDFDYRAGEGDDAAAQALHFFQRIGPAARILATMEPAERAEKKEQLAAFLAGQVRDGVVAFSASAWIWTARTKAQVQ